MTGFQLGTSATAGHVLTTNASGVGTWQAAPSAPVSSVFGRTGAVTAASGDYTTTQVTEGTNLYFTNARAQAAITGGASTIVTSNLTANRALLSNASGKVAVSSVTNTELGYLSGVSSAIQTQLNAKAPTASPTFTGNVTMPGTGIWNSSGNVGIGTTTPSEKLEVAGNIKLSGASPTYKLTNVAVPTASADVATKGYVDAAVGSCPSGFTAIGSYCIQTDEAPGGPMNWFAASDYCYDNYSGATLCSWSQWYNACANGRLINSTDDYEWIDDAKLYAYDGYFSHGALVVGGGGCTVASSNGPYSVAFRCCK